MRPFLETENCACYVPPKDVCEPAPALPKECSIPGDVCLPHEAPVSDASRQICVSETDYKPLIVVVGGIYSCMAGETCVVNGLSHTHTRVQVRGALLLDSLLGTSISFAHRTRA